MNHQPSTAVNYLWCTDGRSRSPSLADCSQLCRQSANQCRSFSYRYSYADSQPTSADPSHTGTVYNCSQYWSPASIRQCRGGKPLTLHKLTPCYIIRSRWCDWCPQDPRHGTLFASFTIDDVTMCPRDPQHGPLVASFPTDDVTNILHNLLMTSQCCP